MSTCPLSFAYDEQSMIMIVPEIETIICHRIVGFLMSIVVIVLVLPSPRHRVDKMVLSYLVSTAGHAQSQNDQHPHDVRTILQLIDEGAQEMGDEKVVGFTSVSEQGEWKCGRLCMCASEYDMRDETC